jgi:hypothetical protein
MMMMMTVVFVGGDGLSISPCLSGMCLTKKRIEYRKSMSPRSIIFVSDNVHKTRYKGSEEALTQMTAFLANCLSACAVVGSG